MHTYMHTYIYACMRSIYDCICRHQANVHMDMFLSVRQNLSQKYYFSIILRSSNMIQVYASPFPYNSKN